jgi:hypothetical protein
MKDKGEELAMNADMKSARTRRQRSSFESMITRNFVQDSHLFVEIASDSIFCPMQGRQDVIGNLLGQCLSAGHGFDWETEGNRSPDAIKVCSAEYQVPI